jgi:hypothetical protein
MAYKKKPKEEVKEVEVKEASAPVVKQEPKKEIKKQDKAVNPKECGTCDRTFGKGACKSCVILKELK